MGDTENQPADSGPLDEKDPILAKLEDMEARLVAATQAVSTAQGQARKAEQQAQLAWDKANALLTKEDKGPGDAVSSLVSRLNDANPAEKLIKDALLTQQATIKEMMGEIQTVKGHRQRQEMDEQQRADRSHTNQELLDRAQDMGFDLESPEFKAIAAKIDQLETGPKGATLWTEGKKILREAAKTRGESGEPKYTETRSTVGIRPRTKVEIEQAYADGDISTEEYVVLRKGR